MFCSWYLYGVETKFNKYERNYDGGQLSYDSSHLSIFLTPYQFYGKATVKDLNLKVHNIAAFYVLQNCENCQSYTTEHKSIFVSSGVENVESVHRQEFVDWFRCRIIKLHNDGQVDKELLSLAHGPDRNSRIRCHRMVKNGKSPTINKRKSPAIYKGKSLAINKRKFPKATNNGKPPGTNKCKKTAEITRSNDIAAGKGKSQSTTHNKATESASVIGGETLCFTTIDKASSSKKKKTGRGKAKGVTRGHGLTLEIYDGRHKRQGCVGSPSQGGNKHQYSNLEVKIKDLEKEVKKLKRMIKLILGKSVQESSQKDVVLTEEDEDGNEDDEVETNDSETKEIALEDD